MKKFYFLLICFFCFPLISFAVTVDSKINCTPEQVKRLNEYVDNINISFKVNEFNPKTKLPNYKITVSNMVKNINVNIAGAKPLIPTKDGDEQSIIYNNTGKVSIYFVYKKNKCAYLASTSINLPKYNKYYDREECEGLSSYDVCKKWSSFSGEEKDFQKAIERAKTDKESKNKKYDSTIRIVKKNWYTVIKDIFIKFWWLVIIILVAIIGLFYAIISKKKKNEYNFKL